MTREGPATLTSGLYFDLHVDYSSRQIVVEGGLDVACAPNVATAVAGLQRAGSGDITVRIEHVTFVDMSGLGVLVGARSSQVDQGFDLVVTGANAQVRRIFDLGDLTDLLAAEAQQ